MHTEQFCSDGGPAGAITVRYGRVLCVRVWAARPRVGCQRPARAICATRLHASWPFGRPEGASAKIVAAEGEYQAAVKLGQAADIITQLSVALQLRTLQTMAEISVEKNSTIMFPAQFMTTCRKLSRSCPKIQHPNSSSNQAPVGAPPVATRHRGGIAEPNRCVRLSFACPKSPSRPRVLSPPNLKSRRSRTRSPTRTRSSRHHEIRRTTGRCATRSSRMRTGHVPEAPAAQFKSQINGALFACAAPLPRGGYAEGASVRNADGLGAAQFLQPAKGLVVGWRTGA